MLMEGGGSDRNFPLFLKKAADILSSKIAVIFRKCARAGTFWTCWRVGNVTPLCKCGSDSSCPSDYWPITITPVLSKVFVYLLAKHLNAFAEKIISSLVCSLAFVRDLVHVIPFWLSSMSFRRHWILVAKFAWLGSILVQPLTVFIMRLLFLSLGN